MKAASITAITATTARAAFAGRLCDDPLAHRFLSRPMRALVWLLRVVPLLLRAVVHVGDRVERGVAVYIACRTRYIDEAITRADADGLEQVVLLGAGYDSRPWRLRASRRRYFEVDHPLTQQRKRAALNRVGLPDASTLVAVDFANDDLAVALAASGFDARRPTLFIWEGVSMFLDAASVERTVATIAELSAPRSRFVADFNYVKPATAGCTAAGALGEPCRYRIAPEELAALVEDHGMKVVDSADATVLRRRYLVGTTFARRHLRQPSYLVTALSGGGAS